MVPCPGAVVAPLGGGVTARTRRVRVLSVPAVHPYVEHLLSASGGDPFEQVRTGPQGPGWAPSPCWDPAWLAVHGDRIDVVHVHFGFEHLTGDQLREWVAALRRLGIGLVLTVHDLENPHLLDQGPQLRALVVLVGAADVVLTLTPGAAREIGDRYGRSADVVPHPHLVDLARMAAARPQHDGFVVGLHAKDRANCRPERVADELDRAVVSLPGGRRQPGPRARLTDEQLWDHLSGLDVLVLPYAFGTHSGFVEACHDLGTAVVAARTGYLHQQQQVISFDLDEPGSLTAALSRAYVQGPARRAAVADRARQRDEIGDAHARVYEAVVRGVRG